MCDYKEHQLPSEFPQGKQKAKVTLLRIHLSLGKARVMPLEHRVIDTLQTPKPKPFEGTEWQDLSLMQKFQWLIHKSYKKLLLTDVKGCGTMPACPLPRDLAGTFAMEKASGSKRCLV